MDLQEAWIREVLLDNPIKLTDLDLDPTKPYTLEILDSGEDDHEIYVQVQIRQGNRVETLHFWEGRCCLDTVERLLRLGSRLERKHPGLFK